MRTRPDELVTLRLQNGESFTVDEHGYLTDPNAWTPAFAEYVAREEGIELTPRHFEVIDFMRTSEADHGIMVDARWVMKFLGDGDKQAGREELFRLFPYGYTKQAVKIAGMKQPRAWSTG